MQELRSCFAPPNYHSDKHVSFAQAPIVCSSCPYYWKDDEYSDDENEELTIKKTKNFDDADEQQSESLSESHYSYLFAVIFLICSFLLLINIRFFPSNRLTTDLNGIINSLENTNFVRAIINFII